MCIYVKELLTPDVPGKKFYSESETLQSCEASLPKTLTMEMLCQKSGEPQLAWQGLVLCVHAGQLAFLVWQVEAWLGRGSETQAQEAHTLF